MGRQVVMVRTLTLTTGTKSRGFTLVEIVAALTVVGLVLAVAVPQSIRFYESVQFRASVRETITLLNSARYAAVASGSLKTSLFLPEKALFALRNSRLILPVTLKWPLTLRKKLIAMALGLSVSITTVAPVVGVSISLETVATP